MQKWVCSLAENGLQVGLFGLHAFDEKVYSNSNITILNNPSDKNAASVFTKLGYVKNVSLLKEQIKQFKPDILHAHYATSYGLLGALSGFQPFIISVWGSDVFEFPRKSFLHKKLLAYIFSKASLICSTSFCMKEEAEKYTSKSICVIPFGVDTAVYRHLQNAPPVSDKKEITIGLVKTMESVYGIDYLLHAFQFVSRQVKDTKLKLLLVGGGAQMEQYRQLAKELSIEDEVTFTGRIPHNEVISYHRQIDIFVTLTIVEESFGVSLVEAMACEKPVIASDVAGFKEVIGSAGCGIIVPRKNAEAAAEAVLYYLQNPAEAAVKAKNARKRVLENYNWKNNVRQMIEVYASFR